MQALGAALEPPACTKQQLPQVLASNIPADVANTVMLGLSILSKPAAGTSAKAAAASTWEGLDALGRALLYIVSEAPSIGSTVALPAGFLSSWTAAAAPALEHLQKHSQQVPPTTATTTLLQLVTALLRLWRLTAIQHIGGRTAGPNPTAPVITSMAVAAELSVLLLTSPGATAAFPQEVKTNAPSNPSVKYLQFAAATTLHVMKSLLTSVGSALMGPQCPVLPAALASDSVQRAMVMHLAAVMPYCLQQMQCSSSGSSSAAGSSKSKKASKGGSSSSKAARAAAPAPAAAAAAEATALKQLQRLGLLQQGSILAYGQTACEAAGVYPDNDDSPRGHLLGAYGGLQMAFVLRRQAMGHPLWPDLYKGSITRPAAAVAAESVDALLAPVVAPGTDPLLLLELLLQLTAVFGVSHVVGMSACLGIGRNSLQPATSRQADKAGVARCLELLWVGLGREVLQAAGVSGEALAEEPEDGAVPAAAAASGTWTDGGGTAGVTFDADQMIQEYGSALMEMLVWRSAFLPPAVELFQQQPQLASRVAEAAVRTCKWPPPHQSPDTDGTQAGRHFHGMSLAAASCGPAGNPGSGSTVAPCFQKIKVVQRCCSLAVSSLKQAQQQLPGVSLKPGWGVHLMPQLLSIAAGAASKGATAWAAGNSAEGGWGPGGVNTAWLALTGRGLLAAGLVLASPVQWFQQCNLAGPGSRVLVLRQLQKLGAGVRWVSECLEFHLQQQQQQQGAVDAGVLRKLQQQAGAVVERWQLLQDQYSEALATGREGLQVAALLCSATFCDTGMWLPGALQELGSAVWSAFPQKYACNDPACGNLEGLTEASCAKKACTDCKIARYCCKEHQLRHWLQHKHACKAFKKSLAAKSSS